MDCKPFTVSIQQSNVVLSMVFKMIVHESANSTFDNAFMTGEQSYKYYNEFMWEGRYTECISVAETIERMKGSTEWKKLLENTFDVGWIKMLLL